MYMSLNPNGYKTNAKTLLEATNACKNYIGDVIIEVFEANESVYPLPLKRLITDEVNKYLKYIILPKWSSIDLTPNVMVSRLKKNNFVIIVVLGNDFATWRFFFNTETKQLTLSKCETKNVSDHPNITIPKR